MFKLHFIELCNINRDLSILYLNVGITYPKLNKLTIMLYHGLYGTGNIAIGTRPYKRSTYKYRKAVVLGTKFKRDA